MMFVSSLFLRFLSSPLSSIPALQEDDQHPALYSSSMQLSSDLIWSSIRDLPIPTEMRYEGKGEVTRSRPSPE